MKPEQWWTFAASIISWTLLVLVSTALVQRAVIFTMARVRSTMRSRVLTKRRRQRGGPAAARSFSIFVPEAVLCRAVRLERMVEELGEAALGVTRFFGVFSLPLLSLVAAANIWFSAARGIVLDPMGRTVGAVVNSGSRMDPSIALAVLASTVVVGSALLLYGVAALWPRTRWSGWITQKTVSDGGALLQEMGARLRQVERQVSRDCAELVASRRYVLLHTLGDATDDRYTWGWSAARTRLSNDRWRVDPVHPSVPMATSDVVEKHVGAVRDVLRSVGEGGLSSTRRALCRRVQRPLDAVRVQWGGFSDGEEKFVLAHVDPKSGARWAQQGLLVAISDLLTEGRSAAGDVGRELEEHVRGFARELDEKILDSLFCADGIRAVVRHIDDLSRPSLVRRFVTANG